MCFTTTGCGSLNTSEIISAAAACDLESSGQDQLWLAQHGSLGVELDEFISYVYDRKIVAEERRVSRLSQARTSMNLEAILEEEEEAEKDRKQTTTQMATKKDKKAWASKRSGTVEKI